MIFKTTIKCECSRMDVIFIDHERAYCTRCIPDGIIENPRIKKKTKKPSKKKYLKKSGR
jgi:hypothetical protein